MKDVLKVVMIGDGGTGKTSIRNQVIHGRFTSAYRATIGADFFTKEIYVAEEDRYVSMQIWDTAGQERFRALGAAFYRGADACVLVFDVTNLSSFEHIPAWLEDFIDKGAIKDPKRYPFILLGNKTDLADERVVNKQMGREMAAWLRDMCAGEHRGKAFVAGRDQGRSSPANGSPEGAAPNPGGPADRPPLAATGRHRSNSSSSYHGRKRSRGSDSFESQRSAADAAVAAVGAAAESVQSAVMSVSTWLRGTGSTSSPGGNPSRPIAFPASGRLSPSERSEASDAGSFRTAGSGSAYSPADEDPLLLESFAGRSSSRQGEFRSRNVASASAPAPERDAGYSTGRAPPPSPPFPKRASVLSASGPAQDGSSDALLDAAPGASARPASPSLPAGEQDDERGFRPDIAYFESSAMTGAHVEDAFAYIARAVRLPVFAFEVGDEGGERISLGRGTQGRGGRRRAQKASTCSC
ncbi:P-loop containing nucleoside triphosphate hydrolase protein [Hyaloraphidium curvatum]|nr:P-loop containing nucleoside triphosphate hydrolase protein [Hyaloraphidium curvatum]